MPRLLFGVVSPPEVVVLRELLVTLLAPGVWAGGFLGVVAQGGKLVALTGTGVRNKLAKSFWGNGAGGPRNALNGVDDEEFPSEVLAK